MKKYNKPSIETIVCSPMDVLTLSENNNNTLTALWGTPDIQQHKLILICNKAVVCGRCLHTTADKNTYLISRRLYKYRFGNTHTVVFPFFIRFTYAKGSIFL